MSTTECIELPDGRRLVRKVVELSDQMDETQILTTITVKRLHCDAQGNPSWRPEYQLVSECYAGGDPAAATVETRKLDHEHVLNIVAALFERERELLEAERLRAEIEELREVERMIKDAAIDAALYYANRPDHARLLDEARLKMGDVIRKIESEVEK